MTEAQKMTNKLKHIWSQTNGMNWDSIEVELKRAEKLIDSGVTDKELISTYLAIKEAFDTEFGGVK